MRNNIIIKFKFLILLLVLLTGIFFVRANVVFAAGGVRCSLEVDVNSATGDVSIIGSVTENRPGAETNYVTAKVYDSVGVGSDERDGDTNATANYSERFSDGTYTAYLEGSGDADGVASDCNQEQTFTVATSNLPDLIAGPTTFNSTPVVGTPVTFTSSIINNSLTGTGTSFYNVLRVATVADGGGTISYPSATLIPALGAGVNNPITSPAYTFPSAGTYSVSFCADNNTSMVGTISESNEGNNCGGWKNVTVYSPSTSCVAGWSEETLIYDTWLGSGTSGVDWCNSRSEGWCSPYPDGLTGGHDPSSKGNITSCCRGSGVYGWERACTGAPTSCSINSFTADNTNLAYNESTNLNFSLNGSFPWSISLLQGSLQPTPISGVSAGGISATGNLTATQVYRLTCGGVTRDLTVSVGSIPQYALAVNMAGTGTGIVTGVGLYNYGDVAHLSAMADSGSTFVGWGGDCDSSGTVTMTSPKTCIATFNSNSGGGGSSGFLLNVSHSVGGMVKSVAPDTGINCGSTCSHEYNSGSSVTLQAIPSSSYWKFYNWSGDCSGSSSTCVLNINSEKNVTAIFTLRNYKIIEF